MPRFTIYTHPSLWLTFLLLSLSFAFGQVSIPAVVTDASGKSVHALQKSDFAVSCGKTCTFDSVEEVPALSFNGFSDPVPVFILFDALSVGPPAQGEIQKQLLNYLRKAADERLAVTLLANAKNGLRVIHDMSTDPKVFLAAMDRVVPLAKSEQADSASTAPSDEFSKAVAQEVQQLQELTKLMPWAEGYKSSTQWLRQGRTVVSDTELQTEQSKRETVEAAELESLRQVGNAFRRSRKRKLLVWMTAYFPISIANGELTYESFSLPYGINRPHVPRQMTPAYQAAIDSLNQARITVYATFVPDAHNYNFQHLAKDTLDGLTEVSRRTGGEMLGILDDFELSSTTADLRRHFDSYYILTFTLQGGHAGTLGLIAISR